MTRNMDENQRVTGQDAYDAWEARRAMDGRRLRKARRLEREALCARFAGLVLRLGTVASQRLLRGVKARARSMAVSP